MIMERRNIYVLGLYNIFYEFKSEITKDIDLKHTAYVSYGNVCQFDGCNKTTKDDGSKLARCGRCLLAPYCSYEHQKAHWKIHKKSCRRSATK